MGFGEGVCSEGSENGLMKREKKKEMGDANAFLKGLLAFLVDPLFPLNQIGHFRLDGK